MRFDSQLSRMNGQMFSMGVNSGAPGGRVEEVISSLPDGAPHHPPASSGDEEPYSYQRCSTGFPDNHDKAKRFGGIVAMLAGIVFVLAT